MKTENDTVYNGFGVFCRLPSADENEALRQEIASLQKKTRRFEKKIARGEERIKQRLSASEAKSPLQSRDFNKQPVEGSGPHKPPPMPAKLHRELATAASSTFVSS